MIPMNKQPSYHVLTVAELREALSYYDDDLPVFNYHGSTAIVDTTSTDGTCVYLWNTDNFVTEDTK